MEKRLQVGIISSTHGIKGEVKVFPTTDDVKRFKKGISLIMDTGRENIALKVEGVKFFKQFAILKFEGYNNINEIEKYKGKSLYVTRENAVRCRRNEYFIVDLIDIKVINEEEQEIGVLKDVIETGANDVYEIAMNDGRELLLPATKECILSVDLEARVMKIHILEGLLD